MSGLGDFLKGAGGGALAGGSFGGPFGAIGGGVLGGLAGIFGGDDQSDQQKRWQQFLNQMNQPQGANTAQDSSFRQDQQGLVSQLEAMAHGQGPSLATQMLKTATDRNVSQQQALSQSGSGNATMAAQGAASNSARLGAQAAQDATTARMAEQMNAIQALGGVLQGARGQDQTLGMFNADQQNSLAARLMQGRLAALSGMQGNMQPSMADQLLAGGAGMFAMGASQRGQQGAGQQGGTPGLQQGGSGSDPYSGFYRGPRY